jgi:hypothetical protein
MDRMAVAAARYPEAVLLHRGDGTGYGFFFYSEADFTRAVESFTKPILRSFQGEPVPNQADPQEHLRTAITTLISQAFDRTIPRDAGSEAVSRAVAAYVRSTFTARLPPAIVIERHGGKLTARPGIEYMRHPGHPMAVVVDTGPHGGEAQFFTSAEEYRRAAERQADTRTWLPQIVYRLYSCTPSVVAGRPLRVDGSGPSVEFRAVTFGQQAPLTERVHH